MRNEQPGDSEAAGAVAGMAEIYGSSDESLTEGVPMDVVILDPTELE